MQLPVGRWLERLRHIQFQGVHIIDSFSRQPSEIAMTSLHHNTETMSFTGNFH